ncbi:MAG: FAD-dependent oxidoreductase [Terriglobia bacterium]|nr:FAD-dependent oxidoreductase [Terriglobia bacterium]
MTAKSTFDIAIAGAGIVGAACAAEFASAGMKVVVIERDMVGSGATAAGMGHIVVMDDSEAQFALTRYSQQLWHELIPQLPAEVEYQKTGTIWVAADEEEMGEVYRKREYYAARGVATEVLDAKSLAAAEPNLRAGLAGGLLVPGDAVLYPPTAAAFLLRNAGCDLWVGKAVARLERGRVILQDGSEILAGTVVNATGSVAPELTPGLAVAPRKGHLVITDRYPGFLHHQLVELGYLKSAHSVGSDSVAFNVQPRRTDQLLIGSSRQDGTQDADVDRQIVRAMLSRAVEYMPGLGKLKAIRTWTGFRAATPDKLPLIGSSEIPGVYLATGHEGLGITTSLATGKLLADQVLRRESAIPFTPYLPSRATLVQSHA